MRTCFHSVGLPDRPLLEVIDLVANADYAAIEINCETLPWAPPHLTPAADAATRRAVAAAAAARGLPIAALGAHVEMVGSNPERRAAALAFVKGCIDLAADLEAPVVHILSGPLDKGQDRETAWAWFRDAVRASTAHAAKRGIGLGVEAIAGHLFHKVDDYHRLHAELADVPFRVNFDPSHLVVQDEDPMRVVAELGARINHVHLKDGRGIFPDFAFPPLGEGTIDFPALAGALRQACYEGALSVEYEAQIYGYHLTEAEILNRGQTFAAALAG